MCDSYLDNTFSDYFYRKGYYKNRKKEIYRIDLLLECLFYL